MIYINVRRGVFWQTIGFSTEPFQKNCVKNWHEGDKMTLYFLIRFCQGATQEKISLGRSTGPLMSRNRLQWLEEAACWKAGKEGKDSFLSSTRMEEGAGEQAGRERGPCYCGESMADVSPSSLPPFPPKAFPAYFIMTVSHFSSSFLCRTKRFAVLIIQ